MFCIMVTAGDPQASPARYFKARHTIAAQKLLARIKDPIANGIARPAQI
jgi:hypothetical protein